MSEELTTNCGELPKTKLKTLKDLKVEEYDDEVVMFINRLRQEAVKWVKFRNIKGNSDFCEFFNIIIIDEEMI